MKLLYTLIFSMLFLQSYAYTSTSEMLGMPVKTIDKSYELSKEIQGYSLDIYEGKKKNFFQRIKAKLKKFKKKLDYMLSREFKAVNRTFLTFMGISLAITIILGVVTAGADSNNGGPFDGLGTLIFGFLTILSLICFLILSAIWVVFYIIESPSNKKRRKKNKTNPNSHSKKKQKILI